MTEYKVFLLNEEGRIHRVLDIVEPSDEAAIARIDRIQEPHGFEVWVRDRLVARVGGSPAQAPGDAG
jgi:hypothetical protein